jgi:hypothetical protein
MSIHKKLYELPKEYKLPPGYKIRPSYKKDAKAIKLLVNNYLKKFKVKTHFTNKEAEHWFIRRESKLIIRHYGMFCYC